MVQNTFATASVNFVENPSVVLAALRSLGRPLTAEEHQLGRDASLALGRNIKNKAKASQEEEVKYLMDRGYTEKEAREQLRLDAQAHREDIGLGVSRRCRFARIRVKSNRRVKAC